MDSTAFTASVENVLSAYLNRNRDVEYDHGLVPLVAPVSSFARLQIISVTDISDLLRVVCMDSQNRSWNVFLLRGIDGNNA